MTRRVICINSQKDGRREVCRVKERQPDRRKKYNSLYVQSTCMAENRQRPPFQSPLETRTAIESLYVSDMMRQWLEHIRNQVKPSTFQKYVSLTHNHILPELGNFLLCQITRAVLEEFAEKRRNNGRVGGGKLSTKTVNDILVVLGLAMEFAKEEWGFSPPKVHFMREEKREARVLTREEQQRLTTYLLENMEIYKFGVLLALYTGLRVGELCALQWEDITEDCVCVSKTMQRLQKEHGKTEIMVGTPKSSYSRRKIPLPGFLLPYVAQFRMSGGYVIRTNRRERAEPRSIQFKFEKMAADCGLTGVSFHTLRHTFATRCVESGFDVKTLSEILGHSDVKTTLNRYVHSSFELKRENMEKLKLL